MSFVWSSCEHFVCKPCFVSNWIFLISRLDFFKLDFLYFKIGFSGFRRHPTGAHVETHSRHPTGVERNRLESSNGGPRSPTICRASSQLASPAQPATAASIVQNLNRIGVSSCEHLFVQTVLLLIGFSFIQNWIISNWIVPNWIETMS